MRKSSSEFNHFSDKWTDIEDLTNRWIKRFPLDYQDNLKWVQINKDELRVAKRTSGGKFADRPMRKGLLLHPSLMIYIQQFHPTFMNEKGDVMKFGSRFRQFVVDTGVLPAKK